MAAVPARIDADAVLRHIRFLASDDLRGRGNGSPGLERAGEYVAEQFQAAGLEPGGSNGSWFQPFELIAGLKVGRENGLTIEAGGQRVALTLGTSYFPIGAPANEDSAVPSAKVGDLPLVFAGYGLAAPSANYDDYDGLDARGKAVLIFSHEPQERDPRSRLNGARPMPQTTLQGKAAAAMNHGARLLIVVSDPAHAIDDVNYRIFGADPDAEDSAIPVLRARRSDLAPLLDRWGLDRVAKEIEADLMPRSRPLPGATVDYVEHLAKNRVKVRNVVGVLRGSDPARAREAVVIGAHYDHVGLGGRLSVTPDRTGEIHNGADDNASGTAAVIEIAKAARQNRSHFPRTLVFVAFAGEERGLLGSSFYTTDPAMPIAGTIGMLNLDMVGRARGSVDVSGLEVSPSMEADLKAARDTAVSALTVRRQGPGAGRSDDSSFIARNVPAINFFTGFHDDYHRPGDDWDKIDAQGTADIAKLALEFAARLAARSQRPEFLTGN